MFWGDNMDLPNEAAILLSVINTKLRDNYANLDELCEDLDIDKSTLTQKLNLIDYVYDEKLNRFI